MRREAVLVLIAALFGGCRDEHFDEADRTYHGGPSTQVCGKRWSHDVVTFYCDGPALRADEMRHFTAALSVHVSDTVVTRGEGARLEAVRNLALNQSKIDTDLLVATFPHVRALTTDSPVDVGKLQALGQMEFLLLHQLPAPDAASVAAIRSLKTLMLNFVGCGPPGCDIALAKQIRALRPDLEVMVNGDVVR